MWRMQRYPDNVWIGIGNRYENRLRERRPLLVPTLLHQRAAYIESELDMTQTQQTIPGPATPQTTHNMRTKMLLRSTR